MRQKYHFATDNGILIWDVTSILEDIGQHPDSYTIQTLSTALLADHNDARVSHTRPWPPIWQNLWWLPSFPKIICC